jgi:hypothetical protein
MADATTNPRLAPSRLSIAAFVFGAGLSLATVALSKSFAADPGDALTRNTIRLSLAWYFAALLLMLRLSPADWRGAAPLGRLARWCWTWGAVCFVVHLAMAFQYFHHWSHAHAFDHTRQVSGVGEGLYFSYLFTLVWLADAAWWWLAPAAYAARSAWIDRLLHSFMLFIVFNGTIVYESGPISWAGALAFAVLAAAWAIRLDRSRTADATRSAPSM